MNQPILQQPPRKKYDGEYVGVVELVNDPEEQMRVKVRVFPIFPNEISTEDLPWAEYKLPIGARAKEGCFTPVKVGDYVWVDFPYKGDTRRPRITGSVHHTPDKMPNFPHDAWAGPDAMEHVRIGKEPAPTNPAYHDGSTVLDENGVLVEIRQDKSFCLTQKHTKTAIEITPDGKITIHGESEINVSSAADTNVIVKGNTNVDCDGKTIVTSAGTVKISAPRIDLNPM
jgi:uncharacterized protein involved in type VI secretion and phage assembly